MSHAGKQVPLNEQSLSPESNTDLSHDFSRKSLDFLPVFLRQAAKSRFQLKCFNEGVTQKLVTVVWNQGSSCK